MVFLDNFPSKSKKLFCKLLLSLRWFFGLAVKNKYQNHYEGI